LLVVSLSANMQQATGDTQTRNMHLPVIAIVGRPNVGKSSLLNALSGKRISIVQDMPGVTRDRISTPLEIDGRFVELVDTGGYGFHDGQGLSDHIKHQIELAMTRADLVLFIVDCQDGLTGADENIASLLRRKGIRAVLIANKADSPNADVALGDFARLGLGTPIGVSAITGRNIDQLFDAISRNVNLDKAPTKLPPPEMFLAIVGKRNAGKSTLVNAIAKLYDERDEQRVIVSEVPGTTRDSIDVRFEKEGKTLVVIDTAGVRKKRHMVTNDIEFYSFHRAERSIRRADVVMMLIDGTERVSEPDKKLAHYISEQYKPVVLVVNKWDLVLADARKQAEERNTGFSDELLMEEFTEYLSQELKHLAYAPVAFITAKDSKKIQTVIDLAQHLFKQTNERVTTGRLNRAVKQIFEERVPSTPRGQRVKVYYATQIDKAPPTIALIVNNPDYVHEDYQRFMINRFRELLPYPEVPIKLLIRPRGAGDKAKIAKAEEALVDSGRKPTEAPARRRTASSSRGAGRRARSRRGR
jgi:GTP-binding protein